MSAELIARDQLKSIVQRVERLELEIKDLNDDKSEVYKEARANGFDVKAIKKVVQKRKLDENVREEQDFVFDTYWDAIHGTNLVHAHARENIEEFDAETGEVFDTVSPRKAAEAVSERTAIQDEAFSSDLVDVITTEAEAGVSGQPEMIPALTGQFPGANVGGPERAGVTAGETATNFPSDDDAIAAVKGRARLANVADVEPSSSAPIAPAAHAEAGSPSAVPQQADRLVEHNPSATFILRPNCLRPDSCAGHGSNHCHSCKAAMRERELA